MIPLRIVETEREDFDGPIVELWRDDEFIGMVFWDGETSVVQVYPSKDGDVTTSRSGTCSAPWTPPSEWSMPTRTKKASSRS